MYIKARARGMKAPDAKLKCLASFQLLQIPHAGRLGIGARQIEAGKVR